MSSLQISEEKLSLAAKTVGMLSADAVEKANSGHPGMPMGAADYGVVVWLKYLSVCASDPKWVNRDRFVLSNGHGSMFLYSMLHLMGFDVTMDDLKQFRQWDSKTPGHPESFMTPGVECTTGPLGQGVANAVGMALGEKLLAARYNTKEFELINHKVFCFCGDGCLMEGVSGEASSIAGHLGLNNLIMLYDDNHISIAGHTELAFTEDVGKRYESYGWYVQHIDGHDYKQIDKAIANAIAQKEKPSIICARTVIGKGSPNKADTHDVHGAALGKEELALTKKNIGFPADKEFYVPTEVSEVFAERKAELKRSYDEWQKMFAAWSKANPELAKKFSAQMSLEVPGDLQDKLLKALQGDGKPVSTRKLSGKALQVVSAEVSSLIGGSADLEPSTLTLIEKSHDVQKNQFTGLNLRFGVREHGMGSIMNGLSYYGGFIPYGSTFFCFSDYMRPAVRIAALSHLPALFIFTHESIFLGEDGPTHQPIEHINSLRAMPNLFVMRPADNVETAVCYRIAAERRDGPCAMLFTRQNLDIIERGEGFDANVVAKGAYTVYESEKASAPELVIVATGSEVGISIAAAKELSSAHSVRVVSMPCWELYTSQPVSYREALIPEASKKIVVEAGSTFGWLDIVGGTKKTTKVIGIDTFGASAPQKALAENFGFTTKAIVTHAKELLSAS